MKAPNTTATGGYLQPAPQPPVLAPVVPRNLSFLDFLQTVIVQLSNLPGPLVRPEWQQNPPKHPDVDVNWIAVGIQGVNPDFNAYVGYLPPVGNADPQPFVQRNEEIPLQLSFYGPNAYDIYGLVRDNLQLAQNLAALRAAKISFNYDTPAQHVPDLINEIWYDRFITTFYFRRQIQRTYPVLTFVSADGTIYANSQGGQTTTLPVTVEEPE